MNMFNTQIMIKFNFHENEHRDFCKEKKNYHPRGKKGTDLVLLKGEKRRKEKKRRKSVKITEWAHLQ